MDEECHKMRKYVYWEILSLVSDIQVIRQFLNDSHKFLYILFRSLNPRPIIFLFVLFLLSLFLLHFGHTRDFHLKAVGVFYFLF